MKKTLLLSMAAMAVVLVSCGNKYAEAYTKLNTEATANLDTTTTVAGVDAVLAVYTTTNDSIAKLGEATAEVTTMDSTFQAAVAAKKEAFAMQAVEAAKAKAAADSARVADSLASLKAPKKK